MSTFIEKVEPIVGGLSIDESVNTIELEIATPVEKKEGKVNEFPTNELIEALLIKLPPLLTLILNDDPLIAGVYPTNVSCSEPPAVIGLLLIKLKVTAL